MENKKLKAFTNLIICVTVTLLIYYYVWQYQYSLNIIIGKYIRIWKSENCSGNFCTVSVQSHIDSSTQKYIYTKQTSFGNTDEVTTPNEYRQQSTLNLETRAKHVPDIMLFEMKRGNVDCEQLINGNESAILRMKKLHPNDVFEDFKLSETNNCRLYRKSRGYILRPVSKKEANFPLAYSILMYRDVLQAERLLRSIYRPQNIYCIHVDEDSSKDVKEGMRSISKCCVKVEWGEFSLVEPELICMKELWKHRIKWKYFINLTGHEFPLKTNLELFYILDAFNSTNIVEGTIRRSFIARWKTALPAHHGIRPTKGNVHVVVNRDYVDFVLHNKTAQDFLQWVNRTRVPDETFFSTLNHNPHLGIRGSYKGEINSNTTNYPYLARYIIWASEPSTIPCPGRWRHENCVFGVGNLQHLVKRNEFFINKILWDFQPLTLFCLEQWHRNKTINDYSGTNEINLTYYKNLDFIKHSIY